MKTTFFVLAFICLLSCVTAADAQNSNGGNSSAENVVENTVKITGRVQIYGNEPFTFTGILDENGIEYAVYPPTKEAELIWFQDHLIDFTVVFLDEPMAYGSLFLKGGTVTPISWDIIR